MAVLFKHPRQITVQLRMKFLLVVLSVVGLCWAEELAKDDKKTVKRGVLGYPGYASGYGYGLHGHYAPVVSTYVAPVVSKISYGYKPYSGYYGGYYGHGYGLHGYGHGLGYGLGHSYVHHYPWHGYYGLGHGYYGLGYGSYGLDHGHYGYGDWW